MFFTLTNVLKKKKKKSQAKKTIRKTMNFGSINWLNKKKKKRLGTQEMSWYFLNTFILVMVGPDMIFYNFILE